MISIEIKGVHIHVTLLSFPYYDMSLYTLTYISLRQLESLTIFLLPYHIQLFLVPSHFVRDTGLISFFYVQSNSGCQENSQDVTLIFDIIEKQKQVLWTGLHVE